MFRGHSKCVKGLQFVIFQSETSLLNGSIQTRPNGHNSRGKIDAWQLRDLSVQQELAGKEWTLTHRALRLNPPTQGHVMKKHGHKHRGTHILFNVTFMYVRVLTGTQTQMSVSCNDLRVEDTAEGLLFQWFHAMLLPIRVCNEKPRN